MSISANEEQQDSNKISDSGSSEGENSITGDQCLGAAAQDVEAVSATVPLSAKYFKLHKLLGEGGFASVYQGQDTIRKELVALKVMHKGDFKDHNMDFTERDILQMSHQCTHLIHGLGAFQTNKFIFYVMELATGGDLHNFINKNFPFNYQEIRFIGAEIICGTQFLHSKGIIHRDVKTENILLSTSGHIKITDFGLCITGVYNTTRKHCGGTPGYRAPEVVYRKEYGPGVDYFAIGAILYKMSLFKLPFPGINGMQYKRSLRYLNPEYPKHLDSNLVSLLQGLLSKDQNLRLGNEDIRSHPFFAYVKWEDMEAGNVCPPYRLVKAAAIPTFLKIRDIKDVGEEFSPKHQKIFNEFSFVCSEWARQYHP
ncbi:positive regulation of sphingomyelin catabolic process, partial [Pristimantis euphronides]